MDPPDTPSPPPRLRPSPRRQNLNQTQTSGSQAHWRTPSRDYLLRPTIRLVPDEDAKVYATSPFPTTQSQVLNPTEVRGSPPVLAPNHPPPVSSSPTPSVTSQTHPAPNNTPPIRLPAPRRNQPLRHYGSIADTLAADNSFNSSSSPITPQSSVEERRTPSSASSNADVERRLEMERGPRGGTSSSSSSQQYYYYRYTTPSEADASEQYASPSEPGSSPRRYERPSAPTPSAAVLQTPGTGASLGAIASRASSLAPPSEGGTPMSGVSVGSSGTVVRNRTSQIATPAGYYRLFPPSSRLPGSVRSNRSNSDPLRPVSMEPDLSPPSSGSPGSPVSPISPDDDGPRHQIYSSLARARSETALASSPSDPRIPFSRTEDSDGSSRPTSQDFSDEDNRQFAIPRRPVGGQRQESSSRWTLGLSTVISEGTAERSSSGNVYSSNNHPSFASSSLGFESSNWPLPAEPIQGPQTGFAGGRAPAGSQIRVVTAEDKDLPPLPEENSPSPSRPRNAHLRRSKRFSQLRNEMVSNRDSATSFTREFRDMIPGWARSYYKNENNSRATIGTRPLSELRSSTFNEPLSPSPRRHTHIGSPPAHQRSSLRVPSSRPRAAERESFNRNSMAITPLYDQPTYVEVRGSRIGLSGEYDWSPHLFYDRRSAMVRRTVFLEPSIDLSYEGKRPTKRNLQVWCFVGGFVFPFAWLIAAFLPLPTKYRTPPSTPGFERDLEKAFGARDQSRYENARWWRNINRGMSFLGIGIIIAVIVLVSVAASRNENVVQMVGNSS